MATPIAALDIGTSKTCVLIAEWADPKTVRILGSGVTLSRGIKKGVVVDVKEASDAIRGAVAQAERVSRLTVEGVYVGLAGSHIQSTNSRGVSPVKDSRNVTQDDIWRVLQAAETIAVPANREVIHSIPRGYTLDGQNGITDPLGLAGFRLEVEAHIVTAAVPSIQNAIKTVTASGLSTIDLVLEPIAAGEAVLTDAEKEMGTVLIDIGGGTTNIAIFMDGSIWHTVVVPTGGVQVTNDLAVGLHLPFAAAEEMKLKWGHVDLEAVDETEKFTVAAFGEEGSAQVTRRQVAEIIRARVEEILHLVLTEIERAGYDNLLPAGAVLCGGTAQFPGMTALARQVLQMPVRLGTPLDLDGLADRVSKPAFATSVGLARWGLTYAGSGRSGQYRRDLSKPSSGDGIFRWARKAFLPEDQGRE